MTVLTLSSLSDTKGLGQAIARSLAAGDVVLLKGPLGAGKTTLARAIIGELCGDVAAPSPTYTLVETYEAPAFSLWHFDLYRLEAPHEIWELGVEEAFADGVSLIEWPERAEAMMPENALMISLSLDGETRRAEISGGEDFRARLQKTLSAFQNRPKDAQ
ncbi:MAG: tRNA (adenosine(37)-N6)-threonylcarbamoyltransferase complex ATPase subunit type 1 TsaE [Pseudomonadota bacterium]